MKKGKYLILMLSIFLITSCVNNNKPQENPWIIEEDNTNVEVNVDNNQEVSIDLSEVKEENLVVEDYITGLNTPWAIKFLSDQRILVSERGGKIILIKDWIKQENPYFEFSDVLEEWEWWLMGLEANNLGHIFAMYTYKNESEETKNKVVRLIDNWNSANFDRVIIDEIPWARFHNGWRLKIWPDEKLYITTWDAQVPSLAQDLSSLAWKVLRINFDWTIPEDNPLENSYIYTLWHRNLQGLAFNESWDLFSSWHGPTWEINSWQKNDRVDYLVSWGNYWWPEILNYTNNPDYKNPLLVWDENTEGNPPAWITFWEDKLFVTTLRTQTLMMITIEKDWEDWIATDIKDFLKEKYWRLRDVVVWEDNNLYVLTSNRDGRWNPSEVDDRILKISLK